MKGNYLRTTITRAHHPVFGAMSGTAPAAQACRPGRVSGTGGAPRESPSFRTDIYEVSPELGVQGSELNRRPEQAATVILRESPSPAHPAAESGNGATAVVPSEEKPGASGDQSPPSSSLARSSTSSDRRTDSVERRNSKMESEVFNGIRSRTEAGDDRSGTAGLIELESTSRKTGRVSSRRDGLSGVDQVVASGLPPLRTESGKSARAQVNATEFRVNWDEPATSLPDSARARAEREVVRAARAELRKRVEAGTVSADLPKKIDIRIEHLTVKVEQAPAPVVQPRTRTTGSPGSEEGFASYFLKRSISSF